MKRTTGILAVLVLTLTATVWAASPFTVNVRVGSATAAPSLVFGQGGSAVQSPFPPFSMPFGVKDIFLANPANFGGTAGVSGDMARLGTDIRTTSDDNQWVLVVASDAVVYFTYDNGDQPLYVKGDKDDAATLIVDAAAFQVKAGVNYTVSQRDDAEVVTPAQDPKNYVVYLTQDEATKEYVSGKQTVEVAGSKVRLNIVKGDEELYLGWTPAGETKWYGPFPALDEVAEKPAAAWCIETNVQPAAIEIADGAATFSFAGGSSNNTIELTATSKKGGLKALSATALEEDGTPIATINWVIISTGTLDFDGNGELDYNDVIYLYDYYLSDFPDAGSSAIDWTGLKDNTTGTVTQQQLETALATLQGMKPLLDFDENGELDYNDVIYLYDYYLSDFPDAGSSAIDWTGLQDNTTGTVTQQQLETALRNLQRLKK